MNKAAAKRKVYAGNITACHLRSLLSTADLSKPFALNRALSRKDAVQIMTEGLSRYGDNDTPETTTIKRSGNGMTLTHYGINAINILTEFG